MASASATSATGRTRANVRERPDATVLWPADAEHPHHSLLVDGDAAVDDDAGQVALHPTSAMLHRSRAGDG